MSTGDRRALVVTVVHHPEDSRIRHRQIDTLLGAGWSVTYAAPFSDHGLPKQSAIPRLTHVDLPRALGRRRASAARAARATVRRLARSHDVLLVHDPELVIALAGLAIGRRVWDVHEDPAAAVVVKEWMPRLVRGAAAWLWRRAERRVERRWDLILAEHAYQDRFQHPHVVVANTTSVPRTVPPPGRGRVVYLGNLTVARGSETLVMMARLLHERTKGEIVTHVIGPARDALTRDLLDAAVADGSIAWAGFLPAREALAHLDGALAGVSLLRDLPNYRSSMPTKLVEYLAHGVPAVTTPLPLAVDLIHASHAGTIVPFDDPWAAAEAVLALANDPLRSRTMGRSGHEYVAAHHNWTIEGPRFIAALEAAASRSR